MYEILAKEVLGDNLYLYEVKAPDVVRNAKAGQFIIIRHHECSERIPLTIADLSKKRESITIVFQVVGRSTQELASFEVGDQILDLVGPLGMPSEIENYGTVVCIGGGVGIAPVYPIARDLKQAGNRVISIIGARCTDLLFWKEKMAVISDELLIVTDDGSEGLKGFVTDALKSILETNKIDRVWAIGPMIMMKSVSEMTRPLKIKTIVSLNPVMVDGTGMCGACRVGIGKETKFACVDGPEFDGHLVDYDLALKRVNFFKEKEEAALSKGEFGGMCRCH